MQKPVGDTTGIFKEKLEIIEEENVISQIRIEK